jgi:sodium/pantothenate symporter
MVRVMASNSTDTIRRSIYLLSCYNALIYIPLVIICVCGRELVPDLPAGKSDEIIPRMALITTEKWTGGSMVAGLILAAPFGAVMATVSSYLVVISSGLVRDLYQRFINPQANEYVLKRLSYLVMVVVGVVAVVANIRPVDYLQALVVFSGAGGAVTFCVPALMACYWRRATAAGAMAGMLGGAGTLLTLYIVGFLQPDPLIGPATKFRPYFLLGFDAILWGLLASLIAGVVVSLMTQPPDAALVSKLFDEQPKEGQPNRESTHAQD